VAQFTLVPSRFHPHCATSSRHRDRCSR
jgi:hypothetical protein